jgi:hypothetical protein
MLWKVMLQMFQLIDKYLQTSSIMLESFQEIYDEP